MEKLIEEVYNAIIKHKSIVYRGVNIGDTIEALIKLEGNNFKEIGGSLPNYKYFYEVGEMEDLIIVYAFRENTKEIYNIELTLKVYPKYYWQEAGGESDLEFFELTTQNKLMPYIKHYTEVKNKITTMFSEVLGKAEVDNRHNVLKRSHQNFCKYTWIKDGLRLVVMTYLDDLKEPQGATTAEIKIILTSK